MSGPPVGVDARTGAPAESADDAARASAEVWRAARRLLDGLPGDRGLNIAHEAVDRHVLHGDGGVVALRCIAPDESVTEVTYADLAALTNRFARVLDRLGVAPGRRSSRYSAAAWKPT